MRPFRGLGWACALGLLAAAAAPSQAGWHNVFQVTCGGCRAPVAAGYYAPAPPPVVTSYYAPVASYSYAAGYNPCVRCYPRVTYRCRPRFCGPIRRLLGLCCPCSYEREEVGIAADVAPPPAFAPATLPASPAPAVLPPAPAGELQFDSRVPPPAPPPVTGRAYSRQLQPQAPVPARRFVPPQPPPTVRLDRVVSYPGR